VGRKERRKIGLYLFYLLHVRQKEAERGKARLE